MLEPVCKQFKLYNWNNWIQLGSFFFSQNITFIIKLSHKNKHCDEKIQHLFSENRPYKTK